MSEGPLDTCWICRQRPVLAGPPAAPARGLCATCDGSTACYDAAWHVLQTHLDAQWKDVVRRGSFDFARAFDGNAPAAALDVHLHFVKRLGGRLFADHIDVDLSGFAGALTARTAHPEITLLIADCAVARGQLRYHDTEVSLLKRDDEVYSALWTHLAFPVAVKVCYLKRSAPVEEPEGFPWHPTRQRNIVKLSPYKGDTRPVHARRDLRL